MLKATLVITIVLSAMPVFGQQVLYFYNGNNLEYICSAKFPTPETTVTVSAASTANPVSFTATAHGFDYQSATTINPIVKIVGGTVNWTAINGVWKATPTSANAFTIPVDSSTFGALTGTLVVTTQSPRTQNSVWSIKKLIYDVANNLIAVSWAGNPGGSGNTSTLTGSTSFTVLQSGSDATDKACASRASYSYQ
jgi:hypothetical protein